MFSLLIQILYIVDIFRQAKFVHGDLYFRNIMYVDVSDLNIAIAYTSKVNDTSLYISCKYIPVIIDYEYGFTYTRPNDCMYDIICILQDLLVSSHMTKDMEVCKDYDDLLRVFFSNFSYMYKDGVTIGDIMNMTDVGTYSSAIKTKYKYRGYEDRYNVAPNIVSYIYLKTISYHNGVKWSFNTPRDVIRFILNTHPSCILKKEDIQNKTVIRYNEDTGNLKIDMCLLGLQESTLGSKRIDSDVLGKYTDVLNWINRVQVNS